MIEEKTKFRGLSLAQRTRQTRSEEMISELEGVALIMFEKRGFGAVTVEEIAAEAQTSIRTFYRYFPTKEDLLQVRIRRRAEVLRDALAKRPSDEPPLHSLRLAFEVAMQAEDPMLRRRWIAVVAATPSALKAVLGGCILIVNSMMAEFFGSRLGVPGDALVPTMLAAAAAGVIQAAQTRWFFTGGDLATTVSESLRVLEEGVGTNFHSGTHVKVRGNGKGMHKASSRR